MLNYTQLTDLVLDDVLRHIDHPATERHHAINERGELIVLSHTEKFGLNETVAFEANANGKVDMANDIYSWDNNEEPVDFRKFADELGFYLVEDVLNGTVFL